MKLTFINGYDLAECSLIPQSAETTIALIAHIQLNRPEKLNAMDDLFFAELYTCFNALSQDENIRVVVITGGLSKHFTSGLDLKCTQLNRLLGAKVDVGRKALRLNILVKRWQTAISALEECLKPVIVGVHGLCIGAGIDLITAADIRYCTKDANFSVKEIDIGLAADLGTLQRLSKVTGNESVVRELCLTGKRLGADMALDLGLVSQVFEDQDLMKNAILKCAQMICLKSPLAVVGTKKALIHARDHSVADGLEFIVNWNSAMLQSEDVASSINMTKNVKYSKL